MSSKSSYDPFSRGVNPVGVQSERWVDATRERTLDVEIWYPATDRYTGRDLDPATQDSFVQVWTASPDDEPLPIRQAAVRDAERAPTIKPLVLFSHGFAGFRREATFICTHLASHGYTVIGADHTGSTSWDVEAGLENPDPANVGREEYRRSMAQARKGDVPFLIAEATRRGLSVRDDVGVTGISLGGWTTLASPAVEPRVRAIAPMCPAGGRSPVAPVENGLSAELVFDWNREVPTLLMIADRDSWLPLDGQMELIARIPTPPRVVVMRNADHNHFVDEIETGHEWFREFTKSLARAYPDAPTRWAKIADNIGPFSELSPAEPAYTLWRGLTVAHFDAELTGNADAAALLSNDLTSTAAAFGASIVTFVRS